MVGLLRPGRALAAALMLFGGLTITVADPSPPQAGATHFRANQLSWHATSTPNEAEFHATGSWRGNSQSYYSDAARTNFLGSTPSVGSYFRPVSIAFGDGVSDSGSWVVTAADPPNNVVSGERHVAHVFQGSGPFIANIDSCCRLSPPLHRNNGDDGVRVETIVDLTRTTSSPASQIPPIVDCGVNGVCQFVIPATDADRQAVSFRFSTPTEAGDSGFRQPVGATIDPSTGIYSWNTTGASLNAAGDSFFSTQVTIDNLVAGTVVSKIAVDFFIRVTTSPNQPPLFNAPTPTDGTTLTVAGGQPLTSFDTQATDPDALDTVTLGIIGLPAGATYTTTAGNPATGRFEWTPQIAGSFIVTLTAHDQNGRGALPRSLTIRVTPRPPVVTLPSADRADTVYVGQLVDFSTTATDPDQTDVVRVGTLGLPAGADYFYTAPPANPSTARFTWTPSAAGATQVVFGAVDNHGVGATNRTVTINAVRRESFAHVNPAIVRISEPTPIVDPLNFRVGLKGVYLHFPYVGGKLVAGIASPNHGAPLGGKTVNFMVGTTLICTSVTGADGQTSCGGATQQMLLSEVSILLAQGYRAEFAGDSANLPTTGDGALISTSPAS